MTKSTSEISVLRELKLIWKVKLTAKYNLGAYSLIESSKTSTEKTMKLYKVIKIYWNKHSMAKRNEILNTRQETEKI